METKIQEIIDAVERSCTPAATLDLLETALARCRVRRLLHGELRKWSSEFTGNRSEKPTIGDVLSHSRHRAAQAYLCVHHALTVDAGHDVALIGPKQLQTVVLYSCMDLVGHLCKWVKCHSVFTAASAMDQSETGQAACERVDQALIDEIAKSLDYKDTRVVQEKWSARSVFLLGPFDLPKTGRLSFGPLARIAKALLAPTRGGSGKAAKRRLVLAQDVAYIKRAMPSSEPWEVEAAVAKHRQALSTRHPEVEGTRRPPAAMREDVKAWIDVIVGSTFAGKTLSAAESVPSLRACYERPAHLGGAFMELALKAGPRNPWHSAAAGSHCPLCADEGDNLDTTYLDRLVEVRPGEVVEVRGSCRAQLALRLFSERVSRYVLASRTGLGGRHEFRTDVLPAAVCEPCKIRMVTLGSSLIYQRALCLQKFMWRALKDVPQFQWIGKPVSDEDWRTAYDPSVCEALLGHYPEGFFVSGDYSAATDNLDPRLSEYCWTAIAREVGVDGAPLVYSPWFEVGLASLTGHYLHHGEKRRKLGPGSPQEWGQLMGSPMSFPILNIVNAAACMAATGRSPLVSMEFVREEDGWLDRAVTVHSNDYRQACYRWRDNNVLLHTNGDDVSFFCESNKKYAKWVEYVTACGLEPSPGKNLTSRVFLQINSELHMFATTCGPRDLARVRMTRPDGLASFQAIFPNATDPLREWVFVPFLNLPLLFGCDSKGSNAGKSNLATTPVFRIGPKARQLVRGCDQKTLVRRLTVWRDFHAALLDRTPGSVIWECPESLGGLGVPTFRDTQIPTFALQRAAWLSCLDTKLRLKFVTPPSIPAVTPWEKALKRAMSSGHRIERIVPGLSEPEERYQGMAWYRDIVSSGGGRGATLGHFLRDWSPQDLDDEDRLESAWFLGYAARDRCALGGAPLEPEGTGPGGWQAAVKPKWLRVLEQGNAARLQVVIAEAMYRRKVAQQVKLVNKMIGGSLDPTKASLHPMKPAHLYEWTDDRILTVEFIQPDYDNHVSL